MRRLKSFLLLFIKKHFGLLAFVFITDLIANCLLLLISLLIAQSYTKLLDWNSARGQLLESMGIGMEYEFKDWLLLLFAAILLRLILDYAKEYSRGTFGEKFTAQLRMVLYKHQLQLHQQHYEEKGTGRYLLRFSGDLNSVQNMISKGLLRFLADFALVTLGIVVIFWLDTYLGLFISVSVFVLGFLVHVLNQIIGKVETKRRNKKSGLLSFVNQTLQGINTHKAFNKGVPMQKQFQKRTLQLKQLGINYFHWSALNRATISFGIYLAIGLSLIIIYNIKQSGSAFNSGKFFAFILILLSWRTVLGRMLRVGLIWKKGIISWKKLINLLDKETETPDGLPPKMLPDAPLELKKVGLQLGSQSIFSNLSFKLYPNEILLLNGYSGSGKTSFVKMLAGIYLPTQGNVYLGGNGIDKQNIKSWRRKITFISDAFPLVGRSVFESISYGRNQRFRDKAEIVFASWQQKFDLLKTLKLDTKIGEQGAKLSKSQIKLLMWIRAILSSKKILVIDDPSKDLDQSQLKVLLAMLPSLRTDRTLILLSSQSELLEANGLEQYTTLSLENFKVKNQNILSTSGNNSYSLQYDCDT